MPWAPGRPNVLREDLGFWANESAWFHPAGTNKKQIARSTGMRGSAVKGSASCPHPFFLGRSAEGDGSGIPCDREDKTGGFVYPEAFGVVFRFRR